MTVRPATHTIFRCPECGAINANSLTLAQGDSLCREYQRHDRSSLDIRMVPMERIEVVPVSEVASVPQVARLAAAGVAVLGWLDARYSKGGPDMAPSTLAHRVEGLRQALIDLTAGEERQRDA